MLHPSTLALSKLAVLMLFNKIFKARPYRLAIGATAAVVLVWLLASLVVAAGLEYGPLPNRRDPNISGVHCSLYHIIVPIPWIVTDLVILILPLPMIWKLHMSMKQKLSLSGVFLLGGL